MSMPFFPQPKPSSRLERKTRSAKEDDRQLKQWKHFVWLRDEGKCRRCRVKCERTITLVPTRGEIHHIEGRANREVRYDVRNGLLLCLKCHQRVTGAVNDKLVIGGTVFFSVNGLARRYIDGQHKVHFYDVTKIKPASE